MWYVLVRDGEASLQAPDVSLHSEELVVAPFHTGFKHTPVGLLQTCFCAAFAIKELWVYQLKSMHSWTGDDLDIVCIDERGLLVQLECNLIDTPALRVILGLAEARESHDGPSHRYAVEYLSR